MGRDVESPEAALLFFCVLFFSPVVFMHVTQNSLVVLQPLPVPAGEHGSQVVVQGGLLGGVLGRPRGADCGRGLPATLHHQPRLGAAATQRVPDGAVGEVVPAGQHDQPGRECKLEDGRQPLEILIVERARGIVTVVDAGHALSVFIVEQVWQSITVVDSGHVLPVEINLVT